MGKKLVSNIKNFIISGGRYQNGIKSIIKSLYPNGYRNFGPDLDRMMMPLNKKYVDISKVMEQISEMVPNNINTNGSNLVLSNKSQIESYFISVIKCLINYIQWDMKKERENYAKYGVLLLIKIIDIYFEKWNESANIVNYLRGHIEIWISKEGTLLKYYGKWILLCLMKSNLQRNIGILTRGAQTENNTKTLNSIPIKNCVLNLKLIELICKNLMNINKNTTNIKNLSGNCDLDSVQFNNKNIIDIITILEIISLGLLTQGVIFEGKSRKIIYDNIIPSLTSILNNNLVMNYGISFHKVKYYQIKETPGQSITSTISEFIKKDNNIFFQGDRMSNHDLIKYLYINYLFIIETLSITLTKEDNHININSDLNSNDISMLNNKAKSQVKINILPSHFKLIDDKLSSFYYYPYILTSDICLSICRGNSEYTIEIINTISQTLRYYALNFNTNSDNENNTLFMRNDPFFIKDEIIISLSGMNDDVPKTILYHKTPQYCYSLLRCLHRILCCCPKFQGLSKWLTTLVNLIDVILPLYDLNGILCSRSKLNESLQVNNGGIYCCNTTVGINEMGKCALLLRNVSFQVLFDIMCLLSETSQVFYVIRVLVKIRDWCGSCLLDLIRRCQRLASQASSDINNNSLDKCNNYIRTHQKNEKSELKNKSLFNNGDDQDRFDDLQITLNNSIDMEIVNPSFWNVSKINEIEGINKKWITSQIGNINNISANNNNMSTEMNSNFKLLNSDNSNDFTNNTINYNKNSSNNVTGCVVSNLNNSNTLISNNNGMFIGGISIEVSLRNQNSSSTTSSPSCGLDGMVSKLCSDKTRNKDDNKNVSQLASSPKVVVNLLNDNYLGNNNVFKHEDEYDDDYEDDDDYDYDDILDGADSDDEDEVRKRSSVNIIDNEEDDYWEVDHKLLELIKLRPTSSLINAQPPISGILRRTVSSDINGGNNRSSLSKIGDSISSLWTKHNSAPPRTLSSMKRVCFSEVHQIY